MLKYIHHVIFDPIFQWDKLKADLLFAGCIIELLITGILLYAAYDTYINRGQK